MNRPDYDAEMKRQLELKDKPKKAVRHPQGGEHE